MKSFSSQIEGGSYGFNPNGSPNHFKPITLKGNKSSEGDFDNEYIKDSITDFWDKYDKFYSILKKDYQNLDLDPSLYLPKDYQNQAHVLNFLEKEYDPQNIDKALIKDYLERYFSKEEVLKTKKTDVFKDYIGAFNVLLNYNNLQDLSQAKDVNHGSFNKVITNISLICSVNNLSDSDIYRQIYETDYALKTGFFSKSSDIGINGVQEIKKPDFLKNLNDFLNTNPGIKMGDEEKGIITILAYLNVFNSRFYLNEKTQTKKQKVLTEKPKISTI
jgi:hypothetical protein